MSAAAGIYKIVNEITGQLYIGSAINLVSRKYRHLNSLRKNAHENKRLQNSFNKYGEAAFSWETLQVIHDLASLIAIEQTFIDELQPYFNICKHAGSRLGTLHSDETKAAIALAKTGKTASDEIKLKMSLSQKGRIQSDETCNKISTTRKEKGIGIGYKHTQEAIDKIAAASSARKDTPETKAALSIGHGWNRGIPFSEAARQKMSEAKNYKKKPVIRIDPITGDKQYYDCARIAIQDGFHASHIGECCSGKQETHKGFIWEYA